MIVLFDIYWSLFPPDPSLGRGGGGGGALPGQQCIG